MNKVQALNFQDFLSFFPEVIPPLTVSNDSIKEISRRNKVLPPEALKNYFIPWGAKIDEFTEFVPCFALPRQEQFIALVYWQAGLLNHSFILVTVDPKTELTISQKVIAGTVSDGEVVLRSVANIEQDLTIQIITGEENTQSFNPLESQGYYMEILPSGEIISQKEDNPLTWLKEEKKSNPKK